MDIILSHTTALEVLRRWDSFRFVESSSATRRPELPGRMPTAREIEPVLAQVRALSGATLPVHVLAASSAGRHPSPKVVAHLALPGYPDGSFFSLDPGVFCSTPELVALQMAEYTTDLELLMLVDELCGHYGIQPRSSTGLVKRNTPLTSVARISAFLDKVGTARCVAKLRRALSRARDRSGSPQESRSTHRLEFEPIRGGYGLDVVALNDPVAVERSDALLVGVSKRIRKPDIILLAPGSETDAPTPFLGVALDYQGGYHRDEAQEGRDINRRNELLAADIKDYEIDKEHYDDVGYLDWLVSCIRNDLGVPEPRVSARSQASWRERRERLCAELAAADGLHWTGRRRGIVMAGAADFRGKTLPA